MARVQESSNDDTPTNETLAAEAKKLERKGYVTWTNQDYDSAASFYKAALEVRLMLHGRDHALCARARARLAVALRQLGGEAAESLAGEHEMAVQNACQTAGGDVDTAAAEVLCHAAAAELLAMCGGRQAAEKALVCYETALVAARRAGGKRAGDAADAEVQVWLGDVLCGMGGCEQELGNLEGALKHYQAASAQWRADLEQAQAAEAEKLGKGRDTAKLGTAAASVAKELGWAMVCEAQLLAKVGRTADARTVAGEAANTLEAAAGLGDAMSLEAGRLLLRLASADGDQAAALAAHRRVLAGVKAEQQQYGADDPYMAADVAAAQAAVAATARAAGEGALARELCEAALDSFVSLAASGLDIADYEDSRAEARRMLEAL